MTEPLRDQARRARTARARAARAGGARSGQAAAFWLATSRQRSRRSADPTDEAASELATLARGGGLALVGSILGSALAFVTVVVISRGLHAHRAGALFEAIALFTILANVAELGADTGLVRGVSRYLALGQTADIPGMVAVAVVPVAAATVLLGGAMFLGARPLADVMFDGTASAEAVTYIRTLALFLPLATLSTVLIAATRGFGTMKPFVVVSNVGVPLLRPVLIVAVLAAGLGDRAVGLAWGAPAALGFLAGAIWLVRLLGRRYRSEGGRPFPVEYARNLAGEFWRFAGPRGLAAMVTVVLGWVDILIVGALRSTAEAGVYATVAKFIGVGTIALQATSVAIAPQISALLARHRRTEAETLFQSATWWAMAFSWPVYIVMAVFAPVLMRVFGAQFVTGATALSILSVAMLVYVGTGNNKNVLLMGGRSSWNLLITGAALAGSLVLDFVLIPRYGIVGAAWAYAFALVADNVATTVAVRVLLKLHPFGQGYARVVAASAVTFGGVGVVVRSTRGATIGGLVAAGVVASAAYLPLLYRWRRDLRLDHLVGAFRRQDRGEAARPLRPVAPPTAPAPPAPASLERLSRIRTESGRVEDRADRLLAEAATVTAAQARIEAALRDLSDRAARHAEATEATLPG